MATLRGAWACVLAATLAGAAWGADEAMLVKHRGDLRRLAIRGAKTFDEAEIKAALAVEIDVAVAARPDAPLDNLRQTLAEKTLDGYLSDGFADVEVDVQFDRAADQLVAEINEGPQYLAGEVKIEGLDVSLAERLRERLAGGQLPVDSEQQATPTSHSGESAAPAKKKRTAWAMGEPAHLDRYSQNWIRERIEAMLKDCGYLRPEFTLEFSPDRQQRTVELKVGFSELGSPEPLDELTVLGNEKLPRDEILEFLDVQPGMRLTREVREQFERKLVQSGRFTKAKVGVSEAEVPGKRFWTWVDVAEYAKAPPLSQPLSREEQALITLSQWLRNFPTGDDDVTIEAEIDQYAIETVVSPRSGVLLLVRDRRDADAKQPGPLKWAFVTSDEQIGFYSMPRGRKLVAIPTPAPLVANVALKLHDGPPRLKGRSQFMFGLGAASPGKRSRRRHCEFRFTDSPVSLLSLAHEYDSKLRWDEDVLTVEYKERLLKFDGKTGRLIEFVSHDEDEGCRLTAAKGQFERKLAELEAAARDLPNDAAENVERPLSSVLEFLADEALAVDDEEGLTALHPQIRVLRKVVTLGLLKPLDRLGVAACQPRTEKQGFTIPRKAFNFYFSEESFTPNAFFDPKMQDTLQGVAEHFGLRLTRRLLSADGWPQAVARDAFYAQAQKASPADCGVDLTKLCASPDAGPLCCLSAAAAAKMLPLGVPASLIANLGKTKLSLTEFQRDFHVLLDADSFLGEYLLCLAEALRGLEAEEVEMLAEMLASCECCDRAALDALVAVAAVMRQHREAPIDEAVAKAADDLWRLGLGARVAALLDVLAVEPELPEFPPPPPGEAYQAATDDDEMGGFEGIPAPVFLPEGFFAPLALEGYCPVTLVEKRAWKRGSREFSVVHEGNRYLFATAGERLEFTKSPERFVPYNCGLDIVVWRNQQRLAFGKREYGVFCNDRIWLFESEASRRKFEQNPEAYVSAEFAAQDFKEDDDAKSVEPSKPMHCEAFPEVALEGPFAESTPSDKFVQSGAYDAKSSEDSENASARHSRYSPRSEAGITYSHFSKYGCRQLPAVEPSDSPAPKAERGGSPLALDGYSTVSLVELHEWRIGEARYNAVRGKQTYWFASEFERQAFLKEPERYSIGNGGFDMVEQIDHHRQTPGKREWGVFCNQRILLFASQESRARFESDWQRYIDTPQSPPSGVRYDDQPAAAEPATTRK